MKKWATRRTNQGCVVKNILLSDIKYNSTCVTLKMPLSLACENCEPELDPHSNTRKKRKRNVDLDERNRCKQYWLSTWNDDSRTTSKVQRHVTVRKYLGIAQDVIIDKTYFEKRDAPTSTKIPAPAKSELHPSDYPSFPWHTIKSGYNNIVSNWLKHNHPDNKTQDKHYRSLMRASNDETSPMPGNVSDGFSRPRKPKRCRVSIFCCGEKYAPTGTQVNLFASYSSVHETPPETNSKFHITISKRKLQTLEKEASIGRKFLSKMNNKKYIASPNARTMLGIMMAHVPKVSLENVELIIAMSNASLFLLLGPTLVSFCTHLEENYHQ